MCLWARGHCFCCCTKDLVGFIFATILCILRHVFAQLPHGLQLAPVIAAKSRMRRSIADQVLVHAVSMTGGGLFVIFWLFWHSREEPHMWFRILLGQLAVGGILSFPVANWNQPL